MSLVLSDALPIQFWLNEELTYNEQTYEYVDQYPFTQQFRCTDNIHIQVSDEEAHYILSCNDCDGNEIFSLPFVEPDSILNLAHKDITFSMTDYLCEALAKFYISKVLVWFSQRGSDPDFKEVFNGASGFANVSGSGRSWSIFASNIQVFAQTNFGEQISKYISKDVSSSSPNGGGKRITLGITASASKDSADLSSLVNSFKLEVVFLESDVPDVKEVYTYSPGGESTVNTYYEIEFDYTPSIVFSDIRFRVLLDDEDYADFVSVALSKVVIVDSDVARSDYVEFTNFPRENIKTEYKSVKPFSGLYYDENSEYNVIRVPSRFFHERNNTTQKAIELSNSTIISASSLLKKQKLLEIDDCPYYMHTKLQLIFAHAASGSIKINEVEWTVAEEYELKDRPSTYPMRPAEIWLNRKNYIKRNVI